MRILTTTVLISSIALSACGVIRESPVNPVNWFGKGRTVPVSTKIKENTNPLIPAERKGIFSQRRASQAIYRGSPIDQVTNLAIERVPGGAIVRATGITAVQGVYDIQLTPENEDELPVDGVLTYRLEGIRPASNQGIGTVHTRTIVAARALSDQQLLEVRSIRVVAARNAQSSRR